MPIYEFKCIQCEKIFEILCFRGDDENNAVCPHCGSQKTKKLLSAFSAASSGSKSGLSSSIGQGGCGSTTGFS